MTFIFPTRSVVCAPADRPGGGNASPRLLKPNLELLTRLRGIHLDGPRRETLNNLAIIDDQENMIRILSLAIGDHVETLTGEKPDIVRASQVRGRPYDRSRLHIFIASTEVEIRSMPEIIFDYDIDLVLTDYDYRINDLTGVDLIRRISAKENEAKDKMGSRIIIGMSAVSVLNRELFYGARADLVLDKPPRINITDLFI